MKINIEQYTVGSKWEKPYILIADFKINKKMAISWELCVISVF